MLQSNHLLDDKSTKRTTESLFDRSNENLDTSHSRQQKLSLTSITTASGDISELTASVTSLGHQNDSITKNTTDRNVDDIVDFAEYESKSGRNTHEVSSFSLIRNLDVK